MSGFPLRFTVGHERYAGTGEDELGNETESWSSPVSVLVFGWEPPKSTEPVLAGHDRVVVDLRLYAPKSMAPAPRDRVVVDGEQFEVIGWPEDPNNNPWFKPGLVTVNLRRVEG